MSEESTRCPRCGGAMAPDTTAYCYGARRADGPVLVRNIPALVCTQCRYAAYGPDVAAEIDRLLHARPVPTRTITVPVYDLIDGRYEAPATAGRK